MIVIYHEHTKITKIVSNTIGDIPIPLKNSIGQSLFAIAIQFPEERIAWCHELYKENLNSAVIENIFHHKKMMLSFNPSGGNYFPSTIGYVEQSPFIHINKEVRYPTWQMSSAVGVLHASVLIRLKKVIKPAKDFDYFLNSLAKLAMPKGLFCYSEPQLLTGDYDKKAAISSKFGAYKFVKQHYKLRWLVMLFLNELLYQKKVSLFPFIKSLFYKSRRGITIDLDSISVNSTLKTVGTGTIDVIIPTIGRKQYLYDVLCDLRKQTHLPKNVIIVEQNPNEESISELDFVTNESWPFTIKHTFTHQPGACNARNIALKQVESEWVFLNDDDNRFNDDVLEHTMKIIKKYGLHTVLTRYLKENEQLKYKTINQSVIFGSGNSFVKASCLKEVSFRMAYEFGYGEDTDFGMQLRHKGYDVIYFPNIKIKHLHAPMGGFRTKFVQLWEKQLIQPKPSPTVMLFRLLYHTKEQLKGYKTILFFKFYFLQQIKSPKKYLLEMNKKWNESSKWANYLKNKHEI